MSQHKSSSHIMYNRRWQDQDPRAWFSRGLRWHIICCVGKTTLSPTGTKGSWLTERKWDPIYPYPYCGLVSALSNNTTYTVIYSDRTGPLMGMTLLLCYNVQISIWRYQFTDCRATVVIQANIIHIQCRMLWKIPHCRVWTPDHQNSNRTL